MLIGSKYSRDTDRGTDSIEDFSLLKDIFFPSIDISGYDLQGDATVRKTFITDIFFEIFHELYSFQRSHSQIDIYKLQIRDIVRDLAHLTTCIAKCEKCSHESTDARTDDLDRSHIELFEPTDDADMCHTTCSATTEDEGKMMFHRLCKSKCDKCAHHTEKNEDFPFGDFLFQDEYPVECREDGMSVRKSDDISWIRSYRYCQHDQYVSDSLSESHKRKCFEIFFIERNMWSPEIYKTEKKKGYKSCHLVKK